MLTSIAQAVAVNAAQVADSAAAAGPTLAQLGRDPMYGLQIALYTWILAGTVGFGIALIMKLLYLHMKRTRVKEEEAKKANAHK